MPVKKTKSKKLKPAGETKRSSRKVRSLKNMVEWDPKKKVWKDLISGDIIMEGTPDMVPSRGGSSWGTTDTAESLTRMSQRLREIADETEPALTDVVDPRVDSAAIVDAAQNPERFDLGFGDLADAGQTDEDIEPFSVESGVHAAIRRYIDRLVIDALRG